MVDDGFQSTGELALLIGDQVLAAGNLSTAPMAENTDSLLSKIARHLFLRKGRTGEGGISCCTDHGAGMPVPSDQTHSAPVSAPLHFPTQMRADTTGTNPLPGRQPAQTDKAGDTAHGPHSSLQEAVVEMHTPLQALAMAAPAAGTPAETTGCDVLNTSCQPDQGSSPVIYNAASLKMASQASPTTQAPSGVQQPGSTDAFLHTDQNETESQSRAPIGGRTLSSQLPQPQTVEMHEPVHIENEVTADATCHAAISPHGNAVMPGNGDVASQEKGRSKETMGADQEISASIAPYLNSAEPPSCRKISAQSSFCVKDAEDTLQQNLPSQQAVMNAQARASLQEKSLHRNLPDKDEPILESSQALLFGKHSSCAGRQEPPSASVTIMRDEAKAEELQDIAPDDTLMQPMLRMQKQQHAFQTSLNPQRRSQPAIGNANRLPVPSAAQTPKKNKEQPMEMNQPLPAGTVPQASTPAPTPETMQGGRTARKIPKPQASRVVHAEEIGEHAEEGHMPASLSVHNPELSALHANAGKRSGNAGKDSLASASSATIAVDAHRSGVQKTWEQMVLAEKEEEVNRNLEIVQAEESDLLMQESLVLQSNAVQVAVTTQTLQVRGQEKNQSQKAPLKIGSISGGPVKGNATVDTRGAGISMSATTGVVEPGISARHATRRHAPSKDEIQGNDDSIIYLAPLLQVRIPDFRGMFRNKPFSRFFGQSEEKD
jgi:hypothetical protein